MKRSIATSVAIAGLLVFAAPALADNSSSSSDASTSTATTSTSTTTDSSTSTPSTTSTTSTPSTTSSTPSTTTSVPSTTTSVPSTTTSVPTTTTSLPATTGTCAVDCIPDTVETECVTADCIPSAGGAVPGTTVGAGSALPFTGISDILAPLLMGLVVVIGGVVAWRWAQLREAVAAAAARARDLPARNVTRTGYAAGMRQLDIEQRAARVFTARVA